MSTKSYTERLYEHFEAVCREFSVREGGRGREQITPMHAVETVGRMLDEIAADAKVFGAVKDEGSK